jgi:hypothetical protein
MHHKNYHVCIFLMHWYNWLTYWHCLTINNGLVEVLEWPSDPCWEPLANYPFIVIEKNIGLSNLLPSFACHLLGLASSFNRYKVSCMKVYSSLWIISHVVNKGSCSLRKMKIDLCYYNTFNKSMIFKISKLTNHHLYFTKATSHPFFFCHFAIVKFILWMVNIFNSNLCHMLANVS